MALSRRATWRLGAAASWEPLWDAADYFERTAQILETAHHWILIVGWQLDSRLVLSKPSGGPPETLRDQLVRLCETRPALHVYLLLWDHPSFYVVQREPLQARVWEELHPNIHLTFDSRHPFGASHHEKVVLVDGRVALAGGVDLCDDRWDSTQHLEHDPRRSLSRRREKFGPYHELGVQVTGPICSSLAEHFRPRWQRLSSIAWPRIMARALPPDSSPHRVWLSRTRSTIDYDHTGPRLIREVEFLFVELIAQATKTIWLEGQYFWSAKVADALIRRMRSSTEPLEITLILAEISLLRSLTGQLTHHQSRLLASLERAASETGGRVRLRVLRPWSGARPVYVHSKLVVIDDRYLSIGSANFSARALRLDSEVMLTLEANDENEQALIRRFTRELEAHWKSLTLEPVDSIIEVRLAQRRAPLLSRLAWERLVDPELPFFYRFKRRWISRLRRREQLRLAGFSLAWLAGFLPLAMFFLSTKTRLSPAGWILAALLYSVWALPIPFLATSLLLAVALPGEVATRTLLLTWWMASLCSLLWARWLPAIQRSAAERSVSRPIHSFGARRFDQLILAWLNPGFTIHQKLLWQSRYWTPLPWVLLVNGLILAGALQALVALMEWLVRA